jgi:hypothetical protein
MAKYNTSLRAKMFKSGGVATSELSAEILQEITKLSGVLDTAAELPLSNNDLGDIQFVKETNSLLMWTGSGWYSIAMVNAPPIWTSEPASTYELETDGTPTVITLVVEDDETINENIQYSVVADSDFNASATITQQDNVFTITPKAYGVAPDAGGGYLTFTADDGVHVLNKQSFVSLVYAAPANQALFDIPGTHEFVVPDFCTSLSAVCVGGGGGGYTNTTYGGGGGGLGWKNNIPVTPGETCTVVVGAGGNSATGGNSYLLTASMGGTPTVMGYGGARGNSSGASGGNFVGDGGGRGGRGGTMAGYGAGTGSAGGGGAGGYSGYGGNGNINLPWNETSGTGGGGGGGTGVYYGYSSQGYAKGGGGGGVGVYGEGDSGSRGGSDARGGGGGSGGTDGAHGYNNYYGTVKTNGTGVGGSYGGGGGSGTSVAAIGGDGAVRIIWGDVDGAPRAFPNTNTQDIIE